MLEVEEVGAMADRVQLGCDGAHDGDDDLVLQLGIDRLQGIDAQHGYSSHISSRVSSTATGESEAWASVCASLMRRWAS